MPLPAMSKVTKYEKAVRLLRYVSRRLLALVCLGISGALLSASLVRFAPGYGVQERELDPRWSAQSVEALRKNQPLQEGLPSFYFQYISALGHGDLGQSDSLKRPVRELLRQRLPVTGNSVIRGLGLAWLIAGLLASLRLGPRQSFYEVSGTAFRGRHARCSVADSGFLRHKRCGLPAVASLHPEPANAFIRPTSRARGTS